MLRNRFRKMIGLVILVVFIIACIRWAYQTSSSEYMLDAIVSGLIGMAALTGIVYGLYKLDERNKKRDSGN